MTNKHLTDFHVTEGIRLTETLIVRAVMYIVLSICSTHFTLKCPIDNTIGARN